MLMTGAQNVESTWPTFMKARASRPIWLPVARHIERLKEHEAVIGSTVLLAHGVGGLQFVVREMPCLRRSAARRGVARHGVRRGAHKLAQLHAHARRTRTRGRTHAASLHQL